MTDYLPKDWLECEVELTASALAHPDCDVRAVLYGFAALVVNNQSAAIHAIVQQWRAKASETRDHDDSMRRTLPKHSERTIATLRACADQLAALLHVSAQDRTIPHDQ